MGASSQRYTLRAIARTGNSFRGRALLYLGLTLSFGVLTFLRASVFQDFNFIVSDGQGYYLYLPALLIHGQLDYAKIVQDAPYATRDFVLKQRPEDFPLLRNKYPIGLALTLSPPFLAAHAFSRILWWSTGISWLKPDGYSVLYQLFCLASLLGLGLITMLIIDRTLELRFQFKGNVIALSLLTFWVGSHYAYYFFREPFMVHLASTFWVTAALACLLRGAEQMRRHEPWGTSLLGTVWSTSMALVCRPTNLVLFPFWIWAMARWLANCRKISPVKLALIALTGLLPVFLQLGVWKWAFQEWVYYSYQGESFHWLNPAFMETLFSSNHGLLSWSPILVLAFLGFFVTAPWKDRIDPAWLFCSLTSFLCLWYLNSAWYCWWFGDAFGGRAFLELAFLYILGFALFYEKAAKWNRHYQYLIAGGILLCGIYNYALMYLYVSQNIPRSGVLF